AQAAREELEGEAAQEVVLGPGEGARARDELLRCEARGGRGLVEGAPLEAHLVGLEEQRVEARGDGLGNAVRGELARPGIDLLLLFALLLHARERGLEVFLGCGEVAPLAALVEIHRARVQREGDGGGLLRGRRAAEVVRRERVETEFLAAADLPQE